VNRRLVSVAAVAAAWAGVALLLAAQTWLSMLSHGHSPWRLAAYQLCVWWGWAALTAPVLWLTRRFPLLPLRPGPILAHAAAALAIAGVHGVFWVTAEVAIAPYAPIAGSSFAELPGFLRARLPIELLVYFAVCAIAHAIEAYSRARRLQESLATARLQTLEIQLQPHFLFNALNSIGALVREGRSAEAIDLLAGLSDLLRYSLDHSGAQSVPLERELETVERYLEIQRMRFPDRMEVRLEVAPEARRARVPALLLQPLVENAVRHGIAASASPGRITVAAARAADRLRVEIFNTGTLRREAPSGIGLANTRERLQTLFGNDQRFGLRAVSGGVLAEIVLPWSEG